MRKIVTTAGVGLAGMMLVVSAACSSRPANSALNTNTTAGQPAATQAATNVQVSNPTTTGSAMTVQQVAKLGLASVVHIETSVGVGSGFIVDSDGYIMTNNHVISDAGSRGGSSAIQVTTADGAQYTASVVGTDVTSDLALLKINAKDLPVLKIGSLENVTVGDQVVAIGYALDIGSSGNDPGSDAPTVTEGIVSAKDRAIDEGSAILGAVQTDAAINHGNSGGPLLNMQGQVIGINTAIVPDQQTGSVASGIGYAVGGDTVQAVYQQLKANGKVDRGFLGIYAFRDLQPAKAKELGVPADLGGVYLPTDTGTNQYGQSLGPSVVDGGPAAQGGMKPGDVIVKIGNSDVHDQSQLAVALIQNHAGDKVTVEVYRGGKKVDLQVTLGTPGSTQQ
ncbi:MAG TPA: trypsin-like peptidase domain-containing protein [Tepidiformaceae bacterium]|nr:trypsin-like peptidase domain-containing protein [Tepidiformaceae bacterium]